MLHTFGNLTLLTQGLNSSVSNGPFVRKRPAITAQSQLLLNAYFQRFGDGDRWAAPEILVRGQELFKVALGVWPRPTLEGRRLLLVRRLKELPVDEVMMRVIQAFP